MLKSVTNKFERFLATIQDYLKRNQFQALNKMFSPKILLILSCLNLISLSAIGFIPATTQAYI